MKILFIHQNFPGQFKHIAPELVKRGHEVYAMPLQEKTNQNKNGIRYCSYQVNRSTSKNIHPWISDFETKIIRAEACFLAAMQLKSEGLYPDLIIAHYGWGESMFLKEVWPRAKLSLYCEFFYNKFNQDVNFDPEFSSKSVGEAPRLMLKNLNNLTHFEFADCGISPTKWQASTYPTPFKEKISVIHDGIDTSVLVPNNKSILYINNKIKITKNDDVITFVNRNLEPYRGYHIFMRSLPLILKSNPKAKVLIVGGDGVSYGSKPPGNAKWKDIFFSEIESSLTDQEKKRIFYLGFISYDNFISLMQVSTVHIYLTYPFVLSWSLLEAMSIGCSVIASDTSPLHEVISHNQNGLLVDFFDYEKLAKYTLDLLSNPILREKLSKNARESMISKYDLKLCLEQQINWIDSIM